MNAGTEDHILLEGEEIDIVDNILYEKTKNHLKIRHYEAFISCSLCWLLAVRGL